MKEDAGVAAESAHWLLLLEITDVPMTTRLGVFDVEIFGPLA